MLTIYDQLMQDVRIVEGLKSCMNCGVCTAICPAAEFYHYDPRMLVTIVQSKDEERLLELLKSETIWYCGQCMSCKSRCPRGNVPGLVIMGLRYLSQKLGYFVESEKGRQQFAIKRTVGDNILKFGYCVYPDSVVPELHPEQGPVWDWAYKHLDEVYDRMDGNYKKEGPGVFRKISNETLDELKEIFKVTGGSDLYQKIEDFSEIKAAEMGIEFGPGTDNDYFRHTYFSNNGEHTREE